MISHRCSHTGPSGEQHRREAHPRPGSPGGGGAVHRGHSLLPRDQLRRKRQGPWRYSGGRQVAAEGREGSGETAVETGALTVMGESRENGVNRAAPQSTGGGAGDGGAWHS